MFDVLLLLSTYVDCKTWVSVSTCVSYIVGLSRVSGGGLSAFCYMFDVLLFRRRLESALLYDIIAPLFDLTDLHVVGDDLLLWVLDMGGIDLEGFGDWLVTGHGVGVYDVEVWHSAQNRAMLWEDNRRYGRLVKVTFKWWIDNMFEEQFVFFILVIINYGIIELNMSRNPMHFELVSVIEMSFSSR